jgi:hypothetical protein
LPKWVPVPQFLWCTWDCSAFQHNWEYGLSSPKSHFCYTLTSKTVLKTMPCNQPVVFLLQFLCSLTEFLFLFWPDPKNPHFCGHAAIRTVPTIILPKHQHTSEQCLTPSPTPASYIFWEKENPYSFKINFS